jgi:hypothetical protein
MLLTNKIKKRNIRGVWPLHIALIIASNIYTKFAEGRDIQDQGDMREYLNLRTKMKRTIVEINLFFGMFPSSFV